MGGGFYADPRALRTLVLCGLLQVACFEKGFLPDVVLGVQVSCGLLQMVCFKKGFLLGIVLEA